VKSGRPSQTGATAADAARAGHATRGDVTTVTRAYAEADRRGLVRGEVGRGTYARSRDLELHPSAVPGGPSVLRRIRCLPLEHVDALADQLAACVLEAARPRCSSIRGASVPLRARAAGADWFERLGLHSTPDQVVVTAGGQHAILVSLLAGPMRVTKCSSKSCLLRHPGVVRAARSARSCGCDGRARPRPRLRSTRRVATGVRVHCT
jgi:hypothetical protein